MSYILISHVTYGCTLFRTLNRHSLFLSLVLSLSLSCVVSICLIPCVLIPLSFALSRSLFCFFDGYCSTVQCYSTHQEKCFLFPLSFALSRSFPRSFSFSVASSPPVSLHWDRGVESCDWYASHFIHVCDMTHSSVPWLIHVCHDPFMCAMTHSCVPWRIHVCHDAFMCAMTHSSVPWLIQVIRVTFTRLMSHTWMNSIIRANVSCLTYEWAMLHMNESCLRRKTGTGMSYVTPYERVMSHAKHKHWNELCHMNESCPARTTGTGINFVTHKWVMSHT